MADTTTTSPKPPSGPTTAKKANGDGTSNKTSANDQASGAKTLKEKLTVPRSATPYFIAALLASIAMGWYFFTFVPQKLEYFVGLRFRTLAVAAGQIKGKSESLGRSLYSAPAAKPTKAEKTAPAGGGDAAAQAVAASEEAEKNTTEYLRLLVPEIQLENPNAAARLPGLQLVANRPDTDPNRSLRAAAAWDRVASQGAAASRAEFDDLVLADKSGAVLWQREKTTPRVGNLTELLYAPDDTGTWMSSSWAIRTVLPAVDAKQGLPKTAALKGVRVGATSTLMLVQAVHLDSPHITDPAQATLYVAGFISRSRLQQQAMRIPLAWLVVVWLPIALLFLVLPFIKLATINTKERFSLVNLALMAIGTIAAAGLAAVIPVGPRSVSDAEDGVLAGLATLVDRNLAKESKAVLALAKAVVEQQEDGATLGKCEVPVPPWNNEPLCDLWGKLGGFLASNKDAPELDVAIWLDDHGEQVRKWTTKAQVTGKATHRGYDHFQNLTSGSLWSLDDDNKIEFTIEPLRAPTTSELGVVFAMPLKPLRDSLQLRKVSRSGADEAEYLALNVRPHAVVDTVLPPGYGFAIVAPDGKVLFHSSDGLSLEENFLEEVSNPQDVRERMQVGRATTWSGDYHGTPHRIHMQSVNALRGCLWKIVTFVDLSPGLASIVDHQSGTFRLSLMNLLLLLAAALIVWWVAKSHGHHPRDLMTAPFVPDPRRLAGLVVLLVLAAAALAATASPRAYQWADILYVFFVLLPFAALGVSVYSRCPSAGRRNRHSLLSRLELAILVTLVGAAPAAGFARIVQRVQDVEATERWLEVAHQNIVAHADRAHARAISPGYAKERRPTLVAHPTFVGGADASALHFYVARAPVSADVDPAAHEEAPESGQVLVRGLLNWSMFSSNRQGHTKVKACAGSNRLQVTDKGISLAATVWQADRGVSDGDQPDREWERWVLAMLILGGTIVAAYWARRRLITPSVVGGSTFEQALRLIASDGNEGIMLIGPPRMRKDRLVTDKVAAHMGLKPQQNGAEPIYRVKLLDSVIDAAFVKKTLGDVSARLKQPTLLDAQNRLWIHVSNLEAQLITAERRTAVLELLEKLLERPDGEPARVVVVTTSIDPIAHFHEIFTKEREGIYDDGIPEVELSRSSLLLSRFRRCYLPIKASANDPWWNYDPTAWKKTLKWEAAGYPPLVEAAKAVKKVLTSGPEPRERVSRAELARAFRSQALACYDLLWESCTRCEKIVLIQLAQEGFVTTENCEVVWGLINKGLIVERPRPTIFNNSFRQFLRHIEHDHVVEQWEREDGDGLWLVAGRLIGSSLIAGGLFYLTTQDFSVDSLLPVVSGTGVFGAPVVRALIARATMRGAAVITA